MAGDDIGGRCLCGEIRFRVTGEPFVKVYCHCRDCRRATGTPVSAFTAYRSGQIEFSRGSPRVYRSSPGVSRSFCGSCGASIYYQTDRIPDITYLFSGLFDDLEHLEPQAHAWVDQAVGWLRIEDELPRYDGEGRLR